VREKKKIYEDQKLEKLKMKPMSIRTTSACSECGGTTRSQPSSERPCNVSIQADPPVADQVQTVCYNAPRTRQPGTTVSVLESCMGRAGPKPDPTRPDRAGFGPKIISDIAGRVGPGLNFGGSGRVGL